MASKTIQKIPTLKKTNQLAITFLLFKYALFHGILSSSPQFLYIGMLVCIFVCSFCLHECGMFLLFTIAYLTLSVLVNTPMGWLVDLMTNWSFANPSCLSYCQINTICYIAFFIFILVFLTSFTICLLYTSPSPRDA